VVITRAGHEPVVIVSLADYESLKETAYLLRSPENARRLLGSIERLEAGRGVRGYWSCRITDEHRLVYKISGDEVRIAACRYHYGS
jgi:Txe/YoeB family toxin of toxin-antitoxin system